MFHFLLNLDLANYMKINTNISFIIYTIYSYNINMKAELSTVYVNLGVKPLNKPLTPYY